MDIVKAPQKGVLEGNTVLYESNNVFSYALTFQHPHEDTKVNMKPEQKGEGHFILDFKYQLNYVSVSFIFNV